MTGRVGDVGSNADPERILVVAPAWVGDLIMCQTLLAVLARRTPAPVVDVLVPEWGVPLVERMPEARRALALDVGHGRLGLARRVRCARELAGRYDRAIVVKRTFKSALVPWLARIPRRTGVRGEARFGLINDVRRLDREQHPLNHARYAALGLEPGAPVDPTTLPHPRLRVDSDGRSRLVARLGLDADSRAVGLAPGAAYGPAKQWPVEHWLALAADLVAQGRQAWIFGSAQEAAVGARIAEEVGHGVWNLAGRTRLTDVVDLASGCDAFVSNDSGLMHLAAAAGAHVVALFGSTSPLNTPPLTARATIVWRELECSPCFARNCPLGHLNCLKGISPQEVLAACAAGAETGPGTPPPGADRPHPE